HSKFNPDEIEREKGVIIEEMNMYYDTPRDFIGGVYEEMLYDDQPLGWEIIGRKENIRNAKRETSSAYVDRWYRAARMVVGGGGGGGVASRLVTEGRGRRGPAYYGYGLNHSYADAGTLCAQAGVDITRIDDAVSTGAAEMRKIAQEPAPAPELEKAKSFSKGR